MRGDLELDIAHKSGPSSHTYSIHTTHTLFPPVQSTFACPGPVGFLGPRAVEAAGADWLAGIL